MRDKDKYDLSPDDLGPYLMADSRFTKTLVRIATCVTTERENEGQGDELEHFPLVLVGFDVICDVIARIID